MKKKEKLFYSSEIILQVILKIWFEKSDSCEPAICILIFFLYLLSFYPLVVTSKFTVLDHMYVQLLMIKECGVFEVQGKKSFKKEGFFGVSKLME